MIQVNLIYNIVPIVLKNRIGIICTHNNRAFFSVKKLKSNNLDSGRFQIEFLSIISTLI